MPPKKRDRVEPTKIEEAVKEVIEKKMPLRSVASAYNISKSHLGRLVIKAKATEDDFNYRPNIGNRRIFSLEQENMLSEYLKISAKMCLGLTTVQVRELAYQYALKLGIAPDKWQANEIATIDWLKMFLKRQSTLSVRKPESTSLARTTAFNRFNVTHFFNNLEVCYNKFKFSPNMIWNTDETGCTTVVNAPKVVAEAGLKRVGQISSAERGALVTMLAFVNAAGGSIPPAFVFPRVHFKSHMLQNGPSGALGLANQSGWISEDCFLETLKHFVKHVKPSKEDPALIILDNHKTHITINGILYSRQNNLILLTFPPHCSHRLQPLDVTVFGPFKSRYRTSMNNWMTFNPGKGVTIYNVAEFAKDAFYAAFNMHNITSGFKSTGIYPLNANIFTDDDFLPSEMSNRLLETEVVQNNDIIQPINTDNHQENNSDERDFPVLPTFLDMFSGNEVPCNLTTTQHSEPAQNTTALSTFVTGSVSDNPVPLTSAVLSPEIVRPFPKAPPRKQKHLKRRVTTKIITSTPEKNRLLAESLTNMLNKKQSTTDVSHVKDIFKNILADNERPKEKQKNKIKSCKKGAQNKKKTNKKVQNKIQLKSSSDTDRTMSNLDSSSEFSDCDYEPLHKLRKSTNNEDVCCVCKQKFSNSKEDWFQCKLCQKWANEKCGIKGTFNFFCNLCH